MVDIHSHVIFGVDDGSPSIKESIQMVLEADKLGIREIIATPHSRDKVCNSEKVEENFHELASRVSDCGVNLHLGYEIFINQDLPEMVKQNKGLRLDGSGYVLVELPPDVIPAYSRDVIYKLHLENIIPIIAHPERNRNCVSNFNTFMSLVAAGCLLQLDAASIMGVYGRRVRNFTKKLIKLKMVHFVASDAHSTKDYSSWYLKARKQVVQWTDEGYADKLFLHNPKAILEEAVQIK